MTTTAYPATGNQLAFIENLVSARKNASGVTDVKAFVETLTTERITKEGASAVINMLLAMAEDAAVVVPGVVDARGNRPFNRFAGKCSECGAVVAAREGTYEGRPGAWRTLHLPGQCPTSSVETIADVSPHSWASATAMLQTRAAGYYAIPSITGTNDFTFFAVKINQGRMNPSKKGQHYFAHIVGGHDENDMKVSPAFIVKALAALDAVGEDVAGKAYADHFTQCYRCGRQLTDQPSRERGLGPECAKKMAF